MSKRPHSILFDAFFRDSSGKIVIAQAPNWPILIAGVFWVAAQFFDGNAYHWVAIYVYRSFLIYWSLLELFKGVNYYRRLLGLVVLSVVIYSFLI